jgi:hypothetical protein
MPHELRSEDRSQPLKREEWITKFVNAVVREFRPGLDRMIAVAAARDEWPQCQDLRPREAAKAWTSRRTEPLQHDPGEAPRSVVPARQPLPESVARPDWVLRFATHLRKVHPLMSGSAAAQAATQAFEKHGNLTPERAAEAHAELLPPTDPDAGMSSDADA